MTVSELIEFLKTQPQDLPVIYKVYSEACVLQKEDITIEAHCTPRADGWVHHGRPDWPQQKYLVFPGN